MKMRRRPKPQRRQRLKVQRRLPLARTQPGRRWWLIPDPGRPWWRVQVSVTRDNRRMRDAVRFWEGEAYEAQQTEMHRCAGMVVHWTRGRGRSRGLGIAIRRGVVARMYLNRCDLRKRPNEITTHECGHAAMAWARMQRANLRHMPGEEVMCYALGYLARDLVDGLFALRVYPR